MSDMKISIEHEGKTYSGQIANIESTSFGTSDHGIVTAYIHARWKGGGIGVGGYCLDAPVKDAGGNHEGREGTAYGLDQLMRIMETVGVDKWERLPHSQVIVLYEGHSMLGKIASGIAGLTNEKVLIFKDHAQKFIDTEGAE